MTIKQQGGVFGRNPTFNDLSAADADIGDLTVNGSTLLRANATVSSLSGSTNLTVENPSANAASALVRFLASGSGDGSIGLDRGLSLFFNTGGSTSAKILYNGDLSLQKGNLIVTNGKGIDFSATSGTGTSELFDDYEEGTWTPLFTDGTNNATMSAFNAGFYTKVGNLVTLSGYIEASSLGSMSGNVKLGGLPFTTAGTGGAHAGSAAGWGNNLNITAGQVVGMITDLGTTTIGLKLWDASTGATNLQASEMLSNTAITINLTYRAA